MSSLSVIAPEAGNEPVIDFAVQELQRFLDRTPPLMGLEQVCFKLNGGSHDGFAFERDGVGRLLVSATTPRSCLYAVYALLESIGWRFAVPGEDRFDAQVYRVEGWRDLLGKTQAAFKWRGLSVVCSDAEEVAAVIDWMPKQRLNTLFLGHNGAVEQAVTLYPQIRERGIRLETGGHILKEFMPDELFEEYPEYFRMIEGQRRGDGNFCTNEPGALRVLAEYAVRYADRLPQADVFHFWAEDVEDGSWCACSACADRSAFEQLMRVTRAAADAISQTRPDAVVDCLLYHDTLELPDDMSGIESGANMFALYGPRERCYAHGLDDRQCPRNRWYMRCLDKARDAFGPRLGVLEYYTSFMLWRNLGLAIPRTILADLRAYRSRAVDMVQTLHFGRLTDWACPLNVYVFARGMWDCDLDSEAVVADFVEARYGQDMCAMRSALTVVERASIHALTYCGYRSDAYDLRDVPLEPATFAAHHRGLVESAIELTGDALEQLPATDHDAVKADRLVLELNRENLRALLHQMRNEYDPAISLLKTLREAWLRLPVTLAGSWRQEAAGQFMLIADMLESAKRGNRMRAW